jgi:hypothetical protein
MSSESTPPVQRVLPHDRVARRTFASRAWALALERAGEWRSVMRVMAVAGPLHSATRLGALAVAAFRLAWIDTRELAAIAWDDATAALRRR